MKAKKCKPGDLFSLVFPALPSRQHHRRGEASVMHNNDKWVEIK